MHHQIGAIANAAKLKRFPDKTGILGSGTSLPLFGRLDPGEHVVSVKTLRRGNKRSDIRLAVDFLDAGANTEFWAFGTDLRSTGNVGNLLSSTLLEQVEHQPGLWNGEGS